MACEHKFQSYLHLEKTDFEPTTLIVGTFNAAWPDRDNAKWFYDSNATNRFWEVLPRVYGEPSLINATAAEWKQFCRSKQIAVTSLISSIDDAEPGNKSHVSMLAGLSDKAIAYNFDDFNFVDIVQLLRRNPTIKNVYLTRGVTEAFWRHLWNPVMHYCNHNKLHERRLLTPSAEAEEQQAVYNNQNPGNQILLLDDYILMKWKQEWHF